MFQIDTAPSAAQIDDGPGLEALELATSMPALGAELGAGTLVSAAAAGLAAVGARVDRTVDPEVSRAFTD